MIEEIVPYQEALELKQLGFNEPCLASYYHAGKRLDICEYINHGEYTILSPTFSQAFRWFRNNYRLNTQIAFCEYSVSSENAWKFTLDNPTNIQIWNGKFSTYEEAELACLKKLIEIANEQQ
jgi:hypothetical protein